MAEKITGEPAINEATFTADPIDQFASYVTSNFSAVYTIDADGNVVSKEWQTEQ